MAKPWSPRSYVVWSIGEEEDRLEADVHSAVCWYSPNSCVGDLLFGCPSTAAVMASPLPCVHTVHGRLSFTRVLHGRVVSVVETH